MKKTKILVPAIAVLALGLAASTTATVAWFQSTKTVNYDATDTETGSISAKLTDLSVGTFTFTLANLSSTDANGVDLTDSDGKSWVYIDATNLQEVTPSNPVAHWTGLTWTVSYSGPSDSADKIAVEWAQFLGTYDRASVAVTSDNGNTHVIRYGASSATAAQCTSNGPYALATDVNLATSVTWGTPTGSSGTYTASVTLSVTAAFNTALTGKTSNEGAAAAGTHAFTVATTLSKASA